MKNLIWLIILFALAVALAVGAKFYSGNVYILVDQIPVMLRMNLHFFIVAVLIGVVVLYIVLNIIFGFVRLPGRWQQWYHRHQQHKVEAALNQAGLAYFEGRFQQALTQAQKVLGNKYAGKGRALALMLAAHSADQANDDQKRDQYLQEMAQLPPKQQLSRYLLTAESMLGSHDYGAAERALQSAADINPQLTRLVRLQLRYDIEQNQPLDAVDKVNRLTWAGAISPTEQQHYYHWAYQQLLHEAKDAGELSKCLKNIPADVRENDLAVNIAEKYLQLGLYPQVAKWVKKIYPRCYNDALLPVLGHAYPYLEAKEQRKVMTSAEGWLERHSGDAQLLLFLGELSYNQQLWGKAQGYLEASLALDNRSIATRLLLAKVFEQSGQPDKAKSQRQIVLSEVSDDEAI